MRRNKTLETLLAIAALTLVVWLALLGLAKYGVTTPEERQAKAIGEATRVAIANVEQRAKADQALVDLKVKQDTAQSRIMALELWYLGLALAGTFLALGLALVVVLWLYNRASMAYPRHGLYPIVVRPGLRGVSIYDANRLPGPNPMITSQAQAIQLAAALSDGEGMTAHERSAAMQEIGRAFQPARSPALLDPPIVQSTLTASHVERLLLEEGRR